MLSLRCSQLQMNLALPLHFPLFFFCQFWELLGYQCQCWKPNTMKSLKRKDRPLINKSDSLKAKCLLKTFHRNAVEFSFTYYSNLILNHIMVRCFQICPALQHVPKLHKLMGHSSQWIFLSSPICLEFRIYCQLSLFHKINIVLLGLGVLWKHLAILIPHSNLWIQEIYQKDKRQSKGEHCV